jgi:hypothetical protein
MVKDEVNHYNYIACSCHLGLAFCVACKIYGYISKIKANTKDHNTYFLKQLGKDGLDFSKSISKEGFAAEIKKIANEYLIKEFKSKNPG